VRGEAATAARQAELDQSGINLPANMAQELGIQGNRMNPGLPVREDFPMPEQEQRRDYRYLPSELGQLSSTIERMRPNEPGTARAVTPHYERDEEGNVTAIVPNEDGSFRQENLGRIGAPARTASEGPTPYQQYQMGRDVQSDDRREEDSRKATARFWQTRLDTFQGKQDEILAEKAELDQRALSLGEELKGDITM
jgi:hypothetical protein